MPTIQGFYLLSRTGFESETSAEANDLAALAGVVGYAQTVPNTAYAVFHCFEPISSLPSSLHSHHWIFARQVVPIIGICEGLDPNDRLSPIIDLLQGQAVSDIIAETPDTNDGKALSGLARALTNAGRQKLKQLAQYQEAHTKLPRLHLLILSGTHIVVGLVYGQQASRHSGGILHLKLPKDAPSRAILKLEEAAMVLMPKSAREQWLRQGMSAVDLGAAPGGWTWWLTQQGLQVIAIDNANMSPEVMKTGQVEHIRADGFAWQPRRPVHWICCDMVEQPQRVTQRMLEWLQNDWAQAALFNLKLPMKKRYAMVQECLSLLTVGLGQDYTIRAKHLYHDREEITVCVMPK